MEVFLISQDKMESFKIIDTCITILEQINEEKYEKYLVHGLLMFYIVVFFFKKILNYYLNRCMYKFIYLNVTFFVQFLNCACILFCKNKFNMDTPCFQSCCTGK